MTPEDKQRIKDAFLDAVNKSPNADQPIPGMAKRDGSPLTSRELVEGTVNNDQFYQQLDRVIASGQKTVDQVIEDFGKMKFPPQLRRQPRPRPPSSGPSGPRRP
jgi:hypothetical protein